MSQSMEDLKEKLENGEEPTFEDLPDETQDAIRKRGVVTKVLGGGLILSALVAALGVFSVIPGGVGLIATGVFVGIVFAIACVITITYLTQKVQQNIMNDVSDMVSLGDDDGDSPFPRGFQ